MDAGVIGGKAKSPGLCNCESEVTAILWQRAAIAMCQSLENSGLRLHGIVLHESYGEGFHPGNRNISYNKPKLTFVIRLTTIKLAHLSVFERLVLKLGILHLDFFWADKHLKIWKRRYYRCQKNLYGHPEIIKRIRNHRALASRKAKWRGSGEHDDVAIITI